MLLPYGCLLVQECRVLVITNVDCEGELSNLQQRLYVKQCLRALLSFIVMHCGQLWSQNECYVARDRMEESLCHTK
jgi:hypothetical protein